MSNKLSVYEYDLARGPLLPGNLAAATVHTGMTLCCLNDALLFLHLIIVLREYFLLGELL